MRRQPEAMPYALPLLAKANAMQHSRRDKAALTPQTQRDWL